MKVVAVSQRVDLYPDRGERRDALDQRLAAWLAAAGYVPAPVPNAMSVDEGGGADGLRRWLGAMAPSAVLLSGGNEIGEVLERDDTERLLLDHARDRSLPVLGICRGMQMLGVQAGTALRQVRGHVRTRHVLQGALTGTANSYHNNALAACPHGYGVTAVAEDGSIEAIRHRDLPWEGWMWHPEREAPFAPADLRRVKDIFGD